MQTVPNPVSVEGLEGRVEFEHVQFGYNPDHIIIHDFNCESRTGTENCHCRTYRSRENDHDKIADAFL